MDNFKSVYLRACEDLKVVPNSLLLLRVNEVDDKTFLNLSNIEFTYDSCRAIGLAVSCDVHVQELDFSNCYLPPEGLISILCGLERNKFIVSLNLRGNNIKSIGTAEVGKLLRHNHYLQKLSLEWNGIGIFPEKFALLCEGLSVNDSLKDLDLRNNSLNHICAQSLAEAIIKNVTLQKLDLRWNSIGLIGGRAILNSMYKNKTLVSVDISGNDIPLDIMKSVEVATAVAAERYLASNNHIEKTKFLISKLQNLEHEKNIQLKTLMHQLERKDKEASECERWTSLRISQLNETLSEKNMLIEDLNVKLHESQKKISLALEEKNMLVLKLNELDANTKEIRTQYQKDLQKEKQEKEAMERKFIEEIGFLKEENIFLKQQTQDQKTFLTHLEDQNLKLEGTISKLEKKSKIDQSSFEEQLASLSERHSEALRESDKLRKSEVARARSEVFVVETNLQQKIALLESIIADKEKELSSKISELRSENNRLEDLCVQLRKQKKIDEENLKQQMEERIKIVDNSKKKLEELLQENLQSLSEIRKRATTLDLELAESLHRNNCLQQAVEGKDSEIEVVKVKAKLEVKEQLEELSDTKKLLQDTYKELDDMKKQLRELEEAHEREMKMRNEEVSTYRNEVEKQKNIIKEILDDENRRNLKLQSAFASYLDTAKRNASHEFS